VRDYPDCANKTYVCDKHNGIHELNEFRYLLQCF
jgi:hypothetical protein